MIRLSEIGCFISISTLRSHRYSQALMRALVSIVFTVGSVPLSAAAPCTSATTTCNQWIKLGSGLARSLVYSTHVLEAKDEKITRALVVIHGGGRNADHYFSTGVAAALLANELENTIVIAPRFASNQGSCVDVLATDEINWNCGEGSGGGWRAGSVSVSSGQFTSFDLTDSILSKLAQGVAFPNLKTITVAGFSAGGQYVNRYAMVNRVHEKFPVLVTYVVGSPSSYGYPDSLRPAPGKNGFQTFSDAQNCTTYDRWSYGLSGRTGYAAGLTDEQIRNQLVSRPVTYLLGELENPQPPALDISCPAMAQGPSRLARGQAFFKYVTEKYGAKHKMSVVPQCGHNDRCVFTADVALPILFPKP